MIQHNLNKLVNPPNTNSISGRDLGIGYAKQINLIKDLQSGCQVEFIIEDEYVKAINDSFVKGLFSEVFEKYKTVANVQNAITITANDHFKKLFLKNWRILENIYNV